MNLTDTELSPLQIGKLRKQGFHTVEELPDTVEKLVEIDGVGRKTAETIVEIKARVQGLKQPPPEEPAAAEEEKPEAPPPAAEKEALPAEEDPEIYPTARLTKYHVACLCALDRQMGRELPQFAYSYLTALVAGKSRPQATESAGRKGAIATDAAVWEALRDFALHFTIQRSRDYGPPPTAVV